MSQSQKEKKPGTGVDAILARHGGISYLEIPATDPRKSANFYANVLGWEVEVRETGEAKFSDPSGHLIGRWIPGRPISREPGLVPYIYVDQIADVVSRVVPNGGEVVKAPYPEGDILVATVRDPAGNYLGLWEATAC
jgi:predicted enzyme related to lactoylglutathione lyase